VTVTADVIGFEDRNWSGDQNISWFELSSRLVRGRTLLADELQEISLAIDHGLSLPQVAPQAVGFLGHSFGGRMALWAPAWDCRIRASVLSDGDVVGNCIRRTERLGVLVLPMHDELGRHMGLSQRVDARPI